MKIVIGDLVNFHGIRGEVKVLSDSDFAEIRFKPGSVVEIDNIEYTISGYRKHKGFHLLTFEGIININEVEHLKGKPIYGEVTEENELDEDEYHYKDIIGLEARLLETGEVLGKVTSIVETGAKDVFVIKGKQEIMIPFVEEFIPIVDLEKGFIQITPIEGMIE
ncbi:ribosome maturation factor RimM [Phocicoccus pinnipedialis]|uniref:Ribosome maturation factor RimM n=1 Tax=Phocicoccus pinnipedialis TaxID=110845 RepID=A0A6V7RHL0_9BACL|nr:ribosome maturation factor RimM [Jeotgalicoccus pinnipedialis]MBP1939096.1 16S rRNA processing protein RimM [Jeotgalicoccus pinnipedialis]CAD2076827.1 Ribosome maturation factor RimM [Jeotgalicoccus pinnipedialis]